MGGTLLDFNPDRLPWLDWEQAGVTAAHAYLVQQGCDLPREELAAAFIAALPERWEQATQGGANLHLGEMVQEACAQLGLTLSAADAAEVAAAYVAPLDRRVVPYADTIDTLQALKDRDLRLGLVSNTMWPGDLHRRQLARLGLAPYFDYVVFSSDAGIWKPQPGIYWLALDALGVTPEQAVFVGDMLGHDIAGAQAVGMRAVYKRGGVEQEAPVEPDATITHLAELPPLIDRWRESQT